MIESKHLVMRISVKASLESEMHLRCRDQLFVRDCCLPFQSSGAKQAYPEGGFAGRSTLGTLSDVLGDVTPLPLRSLHRHRCSPHHEVI